MCTQDKIELDRYTSDYIETFLTCVDILIGSAPELAAEWDEMDDEEHGIQRSAVMSDWGKRYLLGQLYRARRLTLQQEQRLAELDRALLENAAAIEVCYGPTLAELISDLMKWGSPLFSQPKPVRVEIRPYSLPALAQALAA